MKEYIETINSSFIDYNGNIHYFTIVAISKPAFYTDSKGNKWQFEADRYLEEECTEYIENFSKVLYIGISICNPVDKYNEKIGYNKALSRARNSNPVMYVTKSGFISTAVVKALLKQEAEYIKSNPGQYIAGYNNSKEKYLKKKQIEELKNNFSPIEKTIVEEVNRNPKFLDNVQKYLEYCQKHLK